MMADETTQAQGETPAGGENPQTPTTSETLDAGKLQAQLLQVQEALKKANREAAERRKRLDEYEQAEAKRKEAELSEIERANLRIAEAERRAQEAETQLNETKLALMRRDIAAQLNVPPQLADRLRGATADEITADAKTLLAALTKPTTANAGSGAKQQGATQGKSMNDFIRAASGRSQ